MAIAWVRGVPGTSSKLFWPGEIHESGVYIKSDNAM